MDGAVGDVLFAVRRWVGSSGRMTLGLELVRPGSRQPNLHSISGTEPVKWPDSCILHPAQPDIGWRLLGGQLISLIKSVRGVKISRRIKVNSLVFLG